MPPQTAPTLEPAHSAWKRGARELLHSLQVKFFLLILLGFMVTAAAGFLSFQWVYGRIVEEVGLLFVEKQVLYDRERSLAPIRREVTLARMLAESPAILAWLADESSPEHRARGLRELETFRRSFADRSYFFAIAKSGNYYFNDATGQYTGKELRYVLNPASPKDGWFYATLKQPEPCLLNPDFAVDIQVTKLWINCVVRKDSTALAIIGTGIDLSSFIRDVIATPHPRLLTIFLDGAGAIQAHRNPKLINYSSISKSVEERRTLFELIEADEQRLALQNLMNDLRGGRMPVATTFVTIDGVRYLAGLTYIQEFGWFNLTLMGLDLVTQEYYLPILLVLLAALLALLVLSALLVKALVLDRVSQLDASVRAVTRGMYNVTLPQGPADEIGRLEAGFRLMADSVRDTTQNLEAKVEQRTVELRTANETKDRLLSIIAHDLRGPIGMVRGLTHELAARHSGEAELLGAARGAADYAHALLEDLLLWASSHSGSLKPAPVRFNLYFETALTLSGLRAQAREKSIEVVTDVPETLEAFGDVEMVRTILRNLVTNAIKFSHEGSEIRVSARRDAARLYVDVRDFGVGITQEVQSRLFKVGERNVSTLGTRKERGTGLGLVLSLELARKNGGDILLQSAPGQGSTFTLMLPLPPAH
jgi:signal transduction histidine kinase